MRDGERSIDDGLLVQLWFCLAVVIYFMTTMTKTTHPSTPSSSSTMSSSTMSSSSSPLLDRPVPGLTIGTAILGWLVVTTFLIPGAIVAGAVRAGAAAVDGRGNPASSPNLVARCILFFNNLNILIALCEMALGRQIAYIKRNYRHLKAKYGPNPVDAAFAYFFTPLSLRELSFLDSKKWATMWSTYSLWDPSYQNDESFGFFIDVGNGYSTILPCLLWNVAICFPRLFDDDVAGPSDDGSPWTSSMVMSPTLLGFVGAATYWQVLYGTLVYMLSFVWNRRHENRPKMEVVGFVGFANGIWIVFPMLALIASYRILLTNDVRSVLHR
jgi:hypothetical protein